MPASFVSSRTNRATKLERSIDDYLDDEDKNTMIGGVNASASLVANKMYDTNNIAERDKQKSLSKGTDRSIIPGPAIDEFFFVPNKSIGLKLLKSLGWKETRDDFNKHKYNHPPIKDNLYGLGYNYDTANASFLKHKLSSKNNEKKVKYSRQTHVTYDHDDYSDTDVFEDTINRQYDHTLDDSGSDAEVEGNGDRVTPWLHNQVAQYCPTDGKEVLKNFVLATDGLKRLQITEYPLIQAPKSYDPKHYFSKDKKPASRWGDTELAPTDGRTTSRFTVSKVLGDIPKFDASQISIPRSNSDTPATIVKATDSVKPLSRWADTELVPGAASRVTASQVLDDAPKFDANQIVIPHTNSVTVASEIKGAGNTERPMLISEKTQSRFAGLANLVKNKFAPSSQGVTDSTSSITNKKLPSRVTTIWYPEALLCKRFNVPRPALANSSVVGGVAKAATVAPNESVNDDTAAVTINTTISEVESTIFYPLQQERPAASLFESIFCDFDNIINKVESRLAPKVASHVEQKPALSFEFEDDVEKDVLPKALPTVGTKATIFRRIKRDRSVSPESNTISAPTTVALPPKASSSSSDSSSDSSRSHKKSHKKKKRHKNKKGHRR